jgi:diadenylate cyclase
MGGMTKTGTEILTCARDGLPGKGFKLMLARFFELFSVINLLDIAIVSFVLYKAIMWIKGTRAVQLLKGVLVLVLAALISNWMKMTTVSWILDQVRTMLVVALPVVFQPELRRLLERLGRGGLFSYQGSLNREALDRFSGEALRAVSVLSRNSTGALMIIEREIGLNNYIETGITLDGIVTTELLVNIFVPKAPLHDGAVIIRGNRIVAAGCFLPLTENPNISKELGTRHRAALGVTELSDALGIVVSEETGVISVVREGKMTRYLDEESLKAILIETLSAKPLRPLSFFTQWRS